jgi:hypothetical protein
MSLLLLMGDSTPSIGSLFASGEAGLALDVETAYRRGWIFQDSAGATVAAAAGDPVGLILDTAKGGLDSLGSDLVSNGTFASDTVWSKGANWTIGSGVATKTGGAANNLTQTITSTAGLWYRITMDVTRTAGTLTVSLGTSGTTYAITATGTYTFFILAGSSTQTLTLAGDSAFAGTVDNATTRLVPGNHAYQTTSGSRPALARTPDGGRRNLLLQTEAFEVTPWNLFGSATRTANQAAAPNGNTTADKIDFAASASSQIFQNVTATAVAHTFSVYVRSVSGTAGFRLKIFDSAGGTDFLTSDQTATTTWTRFSLTATFTGTVGNVAVINSTAAATGSVLVWGAQLETGSSATAYQKVGLNSDVTESGKRDCWGLLFDGSDDSLQTASVDFSATDKMTVMAGVRKNVDTARATVCELTASIASNNGGFHLTAPNAASDTFAFESKGTSLTDAVATSIAAPATRVLTGIGNIAGDSTSLRVNGAVADTDTGDQGTGNYANAAVFIGSRSGSLRFNGLIYTLIVRGATTPTGTIADFEKNLLRLRAGLGPF